MFNEWSPQEKELMTKLALDGYSASEIALLLPTRTRNAVIGFAHRNNIKLGTRTHFKINATQRIRPIQKVSHKSAPLPAPTECQWLYGEGRNRHFCKCPCYKGTSYCLDHATIVYRVQ